MIASDDDYDRPDDHDWLCDMCMQHLDMCACYCDECGELVDSQWCTCVKLPEHVKLPVGI